MVCARRDQVSGGGHKWSVQVGRGGTVLVRVLENAVTNEVCADR